MGGGAGEIVVAADTYRFDERAISLPADLSRLLEARRFAERAAADFGFDEVGRQQVKLAANEAVANAIEHGSTAPDDEITVRASEREGALVLHISDRGRFAPRATDAGSLPERGRGLAFMDLLMDEVEVRARPLGTEVRLVKRLAG